MVKGADGTIIRDTHASRVATLVVFVFRKAAGRVGVRSGNASNKTKEEL